MDLRDVPRLLSEGQLLKWADDLVRALELGFLNMRAGLTTLTQFTADQNNLRIGPGFLFRVTSDASRTVTGIAGGVGGRDIIIANVGSQNVVLANQSGSSVAENRIITGTGANVTIAPDITRELVYDGFTKRWRLVT